MQTQESKYDQHTLEKIVRNLCTLQIRRSPFSWEAAKAWAKQFGEGPERAVAWLLLRNMIFRTDDQLYSSFRQALKSALLKFSHEASPEGEFTWRQILSGSVSGLSFICAPPHHQFYSVPGKSGELMVRMANQKFGLHRSYAWDITEIKAHERVLLVDDGTFTGQQLVQFLDNSPVLLEFSHQVAIVVALAHSEAIDLIRSRHPKISVHYGEKLTNEHGLKSMCKKWVDGMQWPWTEFDPLNVYLAICAQHSLNSHQLGYGGLGLAVAYQHGVPDDSLALLWEKSATWTPLIQR